MQSSCAENMGALSTRITVRESDANAQYEADIQLDWA